MILQTMVIENFRQFGGKHEIVFADDERRNVTLLHGFNGAGKTALLNAFSWCLYEDHTDDFESRERLENETAFAELGPGGSMTVSVQLTFKVRGTVYAAKRAQSVTRERGGHRAERSEPTLDLYVQEAGVVLATGDKKGTRQSHLNRILSPELWRFFFFNGERVEWLAGSEAYGEVETGLKNLLDIEIYERTINHLRNLVARELANDLKTHGGNDLQDTVDALESSRDEADRLAREARDVRENIARLDAEIEELERRQGELEAVRELVIRRDGLRSNRTLLIEQERSREAKLAQAVSRGGYLAFGAEVLDCTSRLIAEARQRGELPAKIKPQFVSDLLARQTCICGRSLGEHDGEHVAVLETWRQQAGLAEREEAISQTGAAVAALRGRQRELFDSIDELQQERSGLLSDLRRNEEELEDVGRGIESDESGDEAVTLVNTIRSLRRDLPLRQATQIDVSRRQAENDERRSELERKIKSLEVKDMEGERIRRQMEAVARVTDALDEIFSIQKDDVRSDLDRRISEIWGDAAIKDYKASLTTGFRLALTKRVAGFEQTVHGASTGEKQVLALSFVGSLVQKARDNMTAAGDNQTGALPNGGLYPLVMDSPFGSLEDDYRAKVASWIPRLARQVIVLVSKTQWREEVEEGIRPRVGREYILELHTPKAGASRSISINGTELPYVVASGGATEGTRIVEVS